MNDDSATVALVLVGIFIVVILLGVWACLVVFGIKAAIKKNRSPHWMWFGVHPVGALVVFIVMMVIEPLKLCPRCARPAPTGAQVCPYCAYSLVAAPPGAPPAA
jgi:hypothetical protein